MPKIDRRSKLAELRALRAAGKRANYEVEEVDELYEEVDENQYKKIIRDRLDQDDFVVDDNGEGYADDGREEWDRAPQHYSDSEDEMPVKGRGRPSKACKRAQSFYPSSRASTNIQQQRRSAKTRMPSGTPMTETSASTLQRALPRPRQSQRFVL